jgi:hypothetical protein
MKFQIIEDSNERLGSVGVYHNGELHMATPANPYFNEIINRIKADPDDETVIDLFDYAAAIARQIEAAFEDCVNLKVENKMLTYKGQPVPNEINDLAVRFVQKNPAGLAPLAKFLDRVYDNKNAYTRDVLLPWLNNKGFHFNEDGMLVGYKKVNDDYSSVHSGPGIVNGVPCDGNLDNSPGNVLEMDRGSVEFDPGQGCAAGLHVGTYGFARSFSGTRLLMVLVDPKDIVSVPNEDSAKMRVCKYVVLKEVSTDGDFDDKVVISTRGML